MGKEKRVYCDNHSCSGLLPMLLITQATVNVPAACSCQRDLNILLWSGGLPGSHLFEKEMLDFQRAAWCELKSCYSWRQMFGSLVTKSNVKACDDLKC